VHGGDIVQVQGSSCPGVNFLGFSCPGVSCPWVSCPGVNEINAKCCMLGNEHFTPDISPPRTTQPPDNSPLGQFTPGQSLPGQFSLLFWVGHILFGQFFLPDVPTCTQIRKSSEWRKDIRNEHMWMGIFTNMKRGWAWPQSRIERPGNGYANKSKLRAIG